ncbi:cell wall-binding repeat-containing protein [Euzebya pacifica]|uniref:DUF7933 domain-containing protein n=1 Tax=Euzebya pacifica TaxID=1608957 RepID=UPI0013DE7F26|nr:cell wall-binding repeat-containing protein [Euzebya pacifica]
MSVRHLLLISVLAVAMLALPAAPASAGVTVDLDLAYAPSTIGPGSTTRATFTLTNNGDFPVENVGFDQTFGTEGEIVVQTPGSETTSCTGGNVTAVPGSSSVSLSDAAIGANGSCTVAVDVTSSVVGTHTTFETTPSWGNDLGFAQQAGGVDLTVDAGRPGITKSFSPATATPVRGLAPSYVQGDDIFVEIVFDNGLNSGFAFGLSVVDNLPAGLVVADQPNPATSGCGDARVEASPGDTAVSVSGGLVDAESMCVVRVTLTAEGPVQGPNRSEIATSFDQQSNADLLGFAVAPIEVEARSFRKAFLTNPVAPGGVAEVQFTVQNVGGAFSGGAFTDDVDAMLAGTEVLGPLPATPCGQGSELSGSGTGLLTLSDANLPTGETCTFEVLLQLPGTGEAPGDVLQNVTSEFTATLTGDPGDGGRPGGDGPVVLPPAADDVEIGYVPTLVKSFSEDPAAAGSTVTMTVEIENLDPTNAITDIAFADNLSAFVDGSTPSNIQPATNPCGAGSGATLFTDIDDWFLQLTDGSLAAGETCSFTVDLDIPQGVGAGIYTNVVEDFTANTGFMTVVGHALPETLEIVAAPSLVLDVLEDSVLPGEDATIQLELTHADTAPGDATDVGFTLDLQAALPGLVGTNGTVNDLCGPGNGTLSGDVVLFVSGITLQPGQTCAITVTAAVPNNADPSPTTLDYVVQTSPVSARILGIQAMSTPASDVLNVPGLVVTKDFLDDGVIAGGTTVLRFTLANVTPGADFTSIQFSDDLDRALDGMAAQAPLPDTSACGAGSSLTGTAVLQFGNGELAAGQGCTFDVTVQVPAGAADGTYTNTTSDPFYIAGGARFARPARDALEVTSTLISLTKTFTGYPVRAGETIGLEFTLTNLDSTNPLTAIEFTDDLDAVTPGLQAQGLPQADVCGAGSEVSGTSTISLTGGNLPADGSCTFTVDVVVPASLASGGTFVNTTSVVTGTDSGLAVTGDPATDTLVVAGQVGFVKAFDGPTVAGGTVELTFDLSNDSPTDTVAQLQFADDLDAMLSGLSVTGSLPTTPCGPGSSLSTTPVLTLSNGTLGPDTACSFSVTLQVPTDAAPGTYPNQTSDLQSGGIPVAQPAEDDLQVEPPPTFDKVYVPDVIGQGDTTTVTYTIDNSASALDATSLDFTDTLQPGTTVGDPANAATDCTGGTLTAVANDSSISYTGGAVAAGASCTVTADVLGVTGGVYVDDTGDLTSSSGNSGPATDTLEVGTPPTLSKAFADTAIQVNRTTTLSLRIDNTINGAAVTIDDLTDNLPAGMAVAPTPNTLSSCIGGVVDAAAGSTTIGFSAGQVPGAGTCQVDVDVIATATGTLVNTTEPLRTGEGSSPAAQATLEVRATPPAPASREGDLSISGEARPTVIAPGSDTEVVLTITNLGPSATTGSITWTIPDGVVLDDVVGCTLADDGSCSIPTIQRDDSIEVRLYTTHPAAGTDTIAAAVTGIDDPVSDNNSTEVDVVVRSLGSVAQSLIEAAIAASQERFSGAGGFAGDGDVARQADHVVLARVDVFADALAGSVLTKDAPLLFTNGMSLDPGTGNEIRRVLASGGTVYLLGGVAALSSEVEAAVGALGYTPVRLSGPTRIETALAVADEARTLFGGTDVGIARAFGTEGNETAAWADSVTGGGWAADTGTPIVLTPTASLHPAVAAWVEANAPMERVVLGGTAAISEAVATAVNATDRVAGDERAGTAVAISRELRGVEPDGSRSYLLINGFDDDGWGYGMIAAGISADTGAPVLVTQTDTAPPATEAEVDSCAQEPVSLRRVAPTSQLTDALLTMLDSLDAEDCPGQTGSGDSDGDGGGGAAASDGGGAAAPSDQDRPTP